MLLTEAQWDAVVQRLGETKLTACPHCQGQEMNVGQIVFELRPFALGALAPSGPILPVIPLECPECGYLAMFNAVTLGVVPYDEDGEVS